MFKPDSKLRQKDSAMSIYIVSYDLNKVGQNYSCITEKLKAYPKHWHAQQSVWFIVSSGNASRIRDELQTCLDSNDSLFVGQLSSAAWTGLGQEFSRWYKSNV